MVGVPDPANNAEALDPRVLRCFRAFALVTALAVPALGVIVLAGYIFGDQRVIDVAPGLQGMSPLTALMFVSCGAALLAAATGHDTTRVALSAVTAVVASALLGGNLLTGHDPFSAPLANAVFTMPDSQSGSTSVATALCFILLSAALASDVSRSRWRGALVNAFAGTSALIAGVALLGYAYGVLDLYAVPLFRSMAAHTAAGLFVLSLVCLTLHPDERWTAVLASNLPGGSATRRQLVPILTLPVIGWLLLQGMQADMFGPAVLMAAFVVIATVPLIFLVLRDGVALNAVERVRRAAARSQIALNSALETRLAERTAALEAETAERLAAETALMQSQKLEAVGRLTGGLAHDFNNLLQAIDSSLHLLGERLEPGHEGRKYVATAQRATDRGVKVTSQLLAFSRTQRLTLIPTDVNTVILTARDLFAHALGPNITMTLDLTSDETWAVADVAQLELAIINLVVNARDAMPNPGAVKITTRRLGGVAPLVAIAVADGGVGMPPDVKARALEPFFTTKEKGKGIGLGLAQVYGFAKQSGGGVEIESAPGSGTTVHIALPAAHAPAPVDGAREPGVKNSEAPEATAPAKVLVIDDDDAVRQVLVEGLRAQGFVVVEAADGVSGLEVLDREQPNVLVVDFAMEGMTGAEVARRAQAARPLLPILFCSGFADSLALDDVPGARILRKPIKLKTLGESVREALAAH